MHSGFLDVSPVAWQPEAAFCRKSVLLTAEEGRCRDDTGSQRLNEGRSHLLTWTSDGREAP